MYYKKIITNGYIDGVVSGVYQGNITEEEYNQILDVIRNKPQPPEGYDYRLKEDLTWELYQLPEPEEDLEELVRF